MAAVVSLLQQHKQSQGWTADASSGDIPITYATGRNTRARTAHGYSNRAPSWDDSDQWWEHQPRQLTLTDEDAPATVGYPSPASVPSTRGYPSPSPARCYPSPTPERAPAVTVFKPQDKWQHRTHTIDDDAAPVVNTAPVTGFELRARAHTSQPAETDTVALCVPNDGGGVLALSATPAARLSSEDIELKSTRRRR